MKAMKMNERRIINLKTAVMIGVLVALVCCVAMTGKSFAKENSDKYAYKLMTKVKVDVRKKASPKAKLVTTIKKGKVIYSDQVTKSNWFRFKYKGRNVYVKKEKVVVKRTTVRFIPQVKLKTTHTVNVRAKADINGPRRLTNV